MRSQRKITNPPLVSVVVPTHNRRLAATRCIDSILGSDYASLEVMVVDDASTDQTSERLSELFPNIEILRNQEEKLLAGSRNVGCKRAKGEYVLVIDDDNVVHPDAIGELVFAMSNDAKVGIAGPVMYHWSNPTRVWCSGVSRSYLTGLTKIATSIPNVSVSDCYPTEDIPNALMVRKRVFDDIGYFDDAAFPIHYDEADFCKRAVGAGYLVVMVPRATIWHDVPIRNKLGLGLRDLHMTSSMRAYYVARNRLIFMKRYAPRHELLAFVIIFLPAISLAHFLAIAREDQHSRLLLAYAKGIVDGIGF